MLTALMVLLRSIGRICCGHRAIAQETLALRQQVAVLRRTVTRPHLRSMDRLSWVLLAKGWRDWRSALACVCSGTPAEPIGGRLPHGRDDLAAAALRAVLHRAGQPPGASGRMHTDAERAVRAVGDAAGPACDVDAGASAAGELRVHRRDRLGGVVHEYVLAACNGFSQPTRCKRCEGVELQRWKALFQVRKRILAGNIGACRGQETRA